jgi:hypothetical protein
MTKIIPDYVRKFGKKFGAKLSDSSLSAGTVEKTPKGKWFVAEQHDVLYDTEDEAVAAATAKVHSIEITPAMRESARKGFELFQSDKDKHRGSITFYPDGRTIITLFKNRNLSTLLHESGHFYWHVLNEIASHPEASAQIRQDAQTIRDWVKYDPASQTA